MKNKIVKIIFIFAIVVLLLSISSFFINIFLEKFIINPFIIFIGLFFGFFTILILGEILDKDHEKIY